MNVVALVRHARDDVPNAGPPVEPSMQHLQLGLACERKEAERGGPSSRRKTGLAAVALREISYSQSP